MRITTLFLVLLLCFSTNSYANNPIPWLFADFKPCTNIENQFDGYCDKVDSMLFTALPEFQFVKKLASLPRFYEEMQNDALFCTSSFLKTAEREKHMLFSETLFHIMPAVVVMRKRNHAISELVENGQLDLSILQTSNVSVGLRKKRFYGEEVDKFVSSAPKHISIYESVIDNRLVEMTKAGRLDIIFLSPVELALYDTSNELIGIPIKNEAPIPTYASCKNTPRGKQIILAINNVIANLGHEALSQPYQAMLPDNVKTIYLQTAVKAQYPD